MANGWTNKGKAMLLKSTFQATTRPTNYYIALVTSAVAPDADTNTLGQLTQIATGNGYTSGGYSLTPGATDFTLTEDDTNDRGTLLIIDIVFTASGGPIPASGGGARWAVLTDDNVTVGSREVYAWIDLSTDRTVSDGQELRIEDILLRSLGSA